MSRTRRTPPIANVAIVIVVASGGCRAVLGIEALPALGADAGASDAPGNSSDGGPDDDASDGASESATFDAFVAPDGNTADPDWAAWPVPAASPPAAAYTTSGNVVTDSVTGLSWLKATSARLVYADAAPHCAQSTEGGFTDWRVPRWIELSSIVDFAKHDPSISTAVFPSTPNDFHWSQSDSFLQTLRVVVGFQAGKLDYLAASNPLTVVRCVRGAPSGGWNDTAPAYRYDLGGGIARDKKTGLSWAIAISPTALTHAAATTYCAGLSVGPIASGWRMPTVKELLTLVDPKAPVLPRWHQPTFGTANVRELWSSTHEALDARNAWIVDFGVAGQSTDDVNVYVFPVRCVHD